MTTISLRACFAAAVSVCAMNIAAAGQTAQIKEPRVVVDWSSRLGDLKTIPTLQVVAIPLLRRGSPVHDGAFMALRSLGAEYVRFAPWYPYPKLSVAELEPPHDGKTSWDFSLIDPLTTDILEATKGHSVIMNFSTEPVWMFKSDKPVSYPSDPDEIAWSYSSDKGLVDPTARQLADYFRRFVSWYTRGGFTDEYGRFHKSGYHFKIPYWEVLNEPNGDVTPQEYTLWYDAIVAAIRNVSPTTKFVGLALAQDGLDPDWFEFFLNSSNHRTGTPLDMISYHFYATPGPTESIEQWQYSFFSQADQFVSTVRFIESIRKRLSPSTRTTIDEVGSFMPPNDNARKARAPIPNAYWNLSGATYAYLFMKLSLLGIDVLGESQLVGDATVFPDVAMIDWTNGKPNARYWALKLLKEQLRVGDEICSATVVNDVSNDPSLQQWAVQGYRSPDRERKILIINRRNHAAQLTLGPEVVGGRLEVVDEGTGEGPARKTSLDVQRITLGPFAVAVATLH